LYVPIGALNFYRYNKLRDPLRRSFSGNKGEKLAEHISRRLAGNQYLPASFLPTFMNLLPNPKSEGGKVLKRSLNLHKKWVTKEELLFVPACSRET